jgi:hypothetical protein
MILLRRIGRPVSKRKWQGSDVMVFIFSLFVTLLQWIGFTGVYFQPFCYFTPVDWFYWCLLDHSSALMSATMVAPVMLLRGRMSAARLSLVDWEFLTSKV